MSDEKSFHFEQPIKERRTTPKTESQLRTESIERIFAGKTDRQLLEEQTLLAQQQNELTKSIKKNVQFFFWMAILSIAVWIVVSFLADTNY